MNLQISIHNSFKSTKLNHMTKRVIGVVQDMFKQISLINYTIYGRKIYEKFAPREVYPW
jgi:hypothetical protein